MDGEASCAGSSVGMADISGVQDWTEVQLRANNGQHRYNP